MRFKIALLISVFTAGSALSEDLAECITISGDQERLACYDSFAGKVEPKDDEAPTTETGAWSFYASRDEFSEKENSYVMWLSDRANDTLGDAPAALILRCDGNGGTELVVISNGYIGARNGRIPVRYKFEGEEPVSETWHESSNGKAAFLPAGYKDFRQGILSGSDLLFEITDYRGSKYSAKFQGALPHDSKFEFVWNGCQGS